MVVNDPLPDKGQRHADLEWLHRFLNCTVFGPPPSEIQRAHRIVDELASPSTTAAPTEAMIDASFAFSKDLTYLNHPKVRPYRGTDNGDTPEWNRDYVADLLRAVLAASPSSAIGTPSAEAVRVAISTMKEPLERANVRKHLAVIGDDLASMVDEMEIMASEILRLAARGAPTDGGSANG